MSSSVPEHPPRCSASFCQLRSILLRARRSLSSASSSELSILLPFLGSARARSPPARTPPAGRRPRECRGVAVGARRRLASPSAQTRAAPHCRSCVERRRTACCSLRGAAGNLSVLKPLHPFRVGRGGPWLLGSGPGGGLEQGKDSVADSVRDYGEGPGAAGSCSYWQCGSGGETPVWKERRDPGWWIRTSAPV